MSFVEKLDAEALEFFNECCKKKHSEQAVAFLNAYWDEIGDQADFIFNVAWEIMKYVDMESQGISLIHKYTEGVEIELNIGLHFYELMCKNLDEDGPAEYAEWRTEAYAKSQPTMMTAIKRKKQLREKVDVNFDGHISMLEYLLDQYSEFGCKPDDFCQRSMKAPDEHPEITKARKLLEEVNERIRKFEEEKHKLEEASSLPGVKGMRAKNELAQLLSSPLAEDLNTALIKAEAAVRRVQKLFGGSKGASSEDCAGATSGPTEGAVWWMNKDLEVKQKKYGKKK